jgi:tetratricopeptide (TPR) repeat protein
MINEMNKILLSIFVIAGFVFNTSAQLSPGYISDSIRIQAFAKKIDSLRFQNFDSAYANSLVALKIAETSEFKKGLPLIYNTLANVYMEKEDFKNGMFYYFKSLKRYQEIGSKMGEANVCMNIGAAYSRLLQNDKAEKFLNKAIQLQKEHNLPLNVAVAFNNLGIIEFYAGKHREAAISFSNALKEGNVDAIHHLVNTVYINLGLAYSELKQFDSAGYYFNKPLAQITDIPTAYQKALCYLGLGDIAIEKKQLDVAEEYFLRAKNLSVQSHNKKLQKEMNEELSKLYQRKGQYKLALDHYKNFKQWSDSIYSDEMQKQISEIQAEFETVQKDEQIKTLFKDKELAEAKAEREQSVKRLFIVLVAFVLVILMVLGRNVLLKQKFNKILVEKNTLTENKNEELEQKNKLIEEQKQEIENSAIQLSRYNDELTQENILAKYEVLKSKTNPHFLFNSLNTLSALVIKDKTDALRFIDYFSDLYRRVLETSEQNLITVKQEVEIVSAYFYLQQKRFGSDLQTSVNIDPDFNQYYLPPFAIQLMVENAIKHNIVTEDENLTISIFVENGAIVIRNNLNKKTPEISSTNIGQKNLVERYKLISDRLPLFMESNSEYKVVLPIFTSQPA